MTVSLTFGEEAGRRKRIVPPPPVGSEECFNVTIISDIFVEFDETFELLLSTSDEDIALLPNSTTINIVNDDCKSPLPMSSFSTLTHFVLHPLTLDANVTLQMAEYEVLEGDDEVATVCVELTEGVLERGVTVAVSTNDDTAIGKHIYNVTNTACHDPPNTTRCDLKNISCYLSQPTLTMILSLTSCSTLRLVHL